MRCFVAQQFGHVFSCPAPTFSPLVHDGIGDGLRRLLSELRVVLEGLRLVVGRGVVAIFLPRETLDLFLNLRVHKVTRRVIVGHHLQCGTLIHEHHRLADFHVAGGADLILKLKLLVCVVLALVQGVAPRIKYLSFLPI